MTLPTVDSARIAFVLPDMRYGGAERIALRLIRSFADKGHAVDLVLMRKVGELLDELPPEVRVIDLNAERIRSTLRPLVRYLRTYRPSVIQVRMWPLTVAAIVARYLAGVSTKVVVSDHAILSDHYRSRATRAVLRLTTRLFYPLADARVAVSEGAARDLARISGLPMGRFTVIHNPVNLPPEIQSTSEAESLWGHSGGRRILSVGKLKEEKNHELLMRAFAHLPTALDARLMLAGDGPLFQRLQSLAHELGIEESVVLPGYVADPWPLYASADLFVLPSREESFGNVLVEALHAGLPVVSTRTTGATEVLDDGRYGILVEPGDELALARAIEKELAKRGTEKKSSDRAQELSGRWAIDAYEKLLLS